jgi:hypothetical protein
MTTDESARSIERLPRSDVEVHGLSWVEDGRDLALRVQLPGLEPKLSREHLILFRWTEALSINLAFPKGRGGFPFTWDSSFERAPDGTWVVSLDFAHAGALSLICAEIEVRRLGT